MCGRKELSKHCGSIRTTSIIDMLWLLSVTDTMQAVLVPQKCLDYDTRIYMNKKKQNNHESCVFYQAKCIPMLT